MITREIEELKEKLSQYLKLVKNTKLKSLNSNLLENNEIFEAFIESPAASKNHHQYKHGLLEHTVSMMSTCIKIQKQFSFLSLDLLISACLWHDFGKIIEIKDGKYTNKGSLLGHISISSNILHSTSIKLGIESSEEVLLLNHMILSHHGKLEWGSPIIPKIAEAEIFHFVDYFDAQMKVMHEALKEGVQGEFTKKESKVLKSQILKHDLSSISLHYNNLE